MARIPDQKPRKSTPRKTEEDKSPRYTPQSKGKGVSLPGGKRYTDDGKLIDDGKTD